MKSKSLIILIFLFLSTFVGCSKFLDQQPISSISSSEFYKNTKEVGSGVVSCYNGLMSLYDIDFTLTEIRSDNTTTLVHEGVFNAIDHFQDDPTNSEAQLYWQISYNTIYRTNSVLASLNNVSDTGLKQQYEGEARFIRALCYFNLVRLWGGVPLVTKVISPNDQNAFGRTPVDSVYSTIISDLKTAINNLPVSYSSSGDLGRATKGAATGMLAKVYLTLHRYSDALPLLQSLMKAPYSYVLMSNYRDVFYQEMNPEILFAVRYKANTPGVGETFSGEMTPLGPTIRGNNPTQSLLDAYAANGYGIRYKVSVDTMQGDLVCGKYLNNDPLASGGNDWIVLRYADVLLMYAEVTNEINGPTQEGIDAFNMIRTRAGLSTYTVSDFTKDTFRQAIYKERRVELAFEDHRWFDLLRTNEVDSVMKANGAQEGFTFESYRALYPIPQREIDVSNGKLKQNAGY